MSIQDEALEHLVKGIVEHPDDVDVRVSTHPKRGKALVVSVHPDDMGRVIGRSGRTAQALRTVINALTPGRSVRIDFVDPDGR